MSINSSVSPSRQRSTTSTSRRFSRFTRFRKAWFVALVGGFFIAWGTHRFGEGLLATLGTDFGADTHMAAPSGERPNYRRWRASPFDDPADTAIPASSVGKGQPAPKAADGKP